MPSPPITLRCVPDIYLTEERLLMLFSGTNPPSTPSFPVLTATCADFNASVLTPSSSDVVLADVVNRVRVHKKFSLLLPC